MLVLKETKHSLGEEGGRGNLEALLTSQSLSPASEEWLQNTALRKEQEPQTSEENEYPKLLFYCATLDTVDTKNHPGEMGII